MKANFALSLSLDGIRLHHRSGDHWRLIGEVALDDPNMGGALATLRKTALSLEPSGLRTKLIIPDAQIKYLSLSTPEATMEERHQAALQALDGATPYDVSDLAYDISVNGGLTYVAAAARETLLEAEHFAVEHRFSPISTIAVPTEGTFLGEPFFGPTQHVQSMLVDGDVLEWDDAPISGKSAAPIALDVSPEPIEDDRPALVAPAVSETTAPETTAALGGATRDPIAAMRASPSEADTGPALAAPTPNAAMVAEAPGFWSGTDATVGGKPKYLGVILTAILLIFLAGVAAWASVFRDDGLARMFYSPKPNISQEVKTALAGQDTQSLETEDGLQFRTAALSIDFLDDLRAAPPRLAVPRRPEVFTDQPAQEYYAVTGIWIVAPQLASPPTERRLTRHSPTSVDARTPSHDAIALPTVRQGLTILAFAEPGGAPEPTTRLAALPQEPEEPRDAPNSAETLTASGVRVIQGPPPAVPPEAAIKTVALEPTQDQEQDAAAELNATLAAIRPKQRPDGFSEQVARAQEAASEPESIALARLRPQLRPEAQKQVEERQNAAPTARAIARSPRPASRPQNFARRIERLRNQERQRARVAATPAPRAVATVKPRTVKPSAPSRSSVTRQATTKNAINLSRVNLMGVYGSTSNRRALVRLANGRYKKVRVGDRVDGGRVSAIGSSELRYQKNGRNIVLRMPKT